MKNTLETFPITLGERLSQGSVKRRVLFRALNFVLFAFLLVLLFLWCLRQSDMDLVLFSSLISALIVFWFFVDRSIFRSSRHFLLVNDHQGFMRDLRLNEKTAVFDGSNIYHLGHDNKLDAQPLGEIAHLLRSQGYRIVCFFDANVFHTLSDHGAFPKNTRHSRALLKQIFGLNDDEIYVVPSGMQADIFILECLKHLPISFAVSNDKYRDYKSQYPTVMKDHLWRKGVVISDGEIKLLRHRP
jgi:hypothetical protein